MTDAEKRAVWRKFRRYREHPEDMVRELFGVEPDKWQLHALRLFPKSRRLALKACKGPGKTAVLAWLILNFLLTRPYSLVGCTSITGGNLDTNLWPELSRWIEKSPVLQSIFVWTATRVSHRQHPSHWFAVARSWSKSANAEEQSNALAGLHADFVMWVLDESGGMPQSIMATAEGAMATGIEMKIVQAGNPTHTTGPLYRACTIDKRLWDVITITGDPDDPNRSPRIDMTWAREQIEMYGRDNPWVKVNVLGEFPPASINALLGVEEVEAAMKRHLVEHEYNWAQKRLGVDVARFGDDRTVIFPRQGLASWRPIVMRNARTTAIAARVLKAALSWGAELTLVDDTGHWGHGVIDNLHLTPIGVIGINYAGKATDPRFKNVRAEMYMVGAQAIKDGAALPNLPEMVGELTEQTYMFHEGKFILEEKDQVKKRLGRSPDMADAYMQTYAIDDMPAAMMGAARTTGHATTDFDPYALSPVGQAAREFDPN